MYVYILNLIGKNATRVYLLISIEGRKSIYL